MMRTAAFTFARRTAICSSRYIPSCLATRAINVHSSSLQYDSKEVGGELTAKSGLFGTNFSEWYALPIGIAAAIPAIKFEWYVINEETQLAAVFVAFCVALYSSGGDAIYKMLDERAQIILKDHNETEDKVINALELKLDFLKANQNMVEDFELINSMREQAYSNLIAAGAIKPKHDLKGQIERILTMIAAEEARVTEKTKIALMDEAIASVTVMFASSNKLKKSALDDAIATIQGGKATGVEPVQASFVKFFKEKATAAAITSGDGTNETSQRIDLITKMNTICKTEGFFFNFDDDGMPKMIVSV